MKRFLSFIMCFVLLIAALAGCSNKPTDVRILNISNSASALLSHMLEPDENKSINYISTVVNLPNRSRTLFADGECDVAVVPFETATSLYRSANPEIKLLAGISAGGFELVSTKGITDFSELKGQTIYLTDRGTIMESILKYAISLYGVDPFEDVLFDYASDTKQLENKLKNNEIHFALLSSAQMFEIKSTVEGLNSYNLTDVLVKKLKNPSIINYCVIATSDFVENNPKIVKKMLEDIESSVKNSSDASKTINLAKKHELLTDDFYSEDFLASCMPKYISGEKMKEQLTAYFSLLKKIKASNIGNSKPKDDFYYILEK